MTKKWTKRSYDALFTWINPADRPHAKEIMLADGLGDEVQTLEKAENMGVWYKMTGLAAKAVGPQVVEESAKDAERELEQLAKTNK